VDQPFAVSRLLVWLLIAAGLSAFAQSPAVPNQRPRPEISNGYLLQPDDEVTIRSLASKEITDKTFRVDQNGEVNLPLVGVAQIGGRTVRDAEKTIAAELSKYYLQPDVQINLTSLHTEPISVLGAVGSPGVYPLKDHTLLLEALSAAGGVRGDAGPTVIVTRQKGFGPIVHRDARQMLTGESVVEIDLKVLTEAKDSAENIVIKPHDVISVPAAQLVYVVGSVKKGGGFALAGRPSLTVLQALALCEGLDPRAAPDRARILRRGPNSEEQIPVNMKKIMAGKIEDVVLRPNDVLFVPTNAMKAITNRTIEAAIQIGTGLAIFHP
jgi:polysaccharide export outer membrane protein